MPKTEDLRSQQVEELEANVVEIQRELYDLTNEYGLTKKIEKPHMLRLKKREIARMKTIIREKRSG